MTKQEMKVLEQAYAAEIDGALNKGLGLLQSRSKIAQKLADEGYLKWVQVDLGGPFPMTASGYELTHLGRLTYCQSCE